MADFFNKDQVTEPMNPDTDNTPDTIKLGDREFTQEELDRRIGLSDIALEAEDKYGVTIDKVWPNHQRTINEKLALEQELKTLREAQTALPKTEEQLSQEQISAKAREELSKLGYKTEAEVRELIRNEMNGQRLIADTQSTINEMTELGYPATTVEDLFTFMSDPANPKNPKQAYKLMFEEDIDRVKEAKIQSLKGGGVVTTSSSTAGSKAPAPTKITGQNLRDALVAALPD